MGFSLKIEMTTLSAINYLRSNDGKKDGEKILPFIIN